MSESIDLKKVFKFLDIPEEEIENAFDGNVTFKDLYDFSTIMTITLANTCPDISCKFHDGDKFVIRFAYDGDSNFVCCRPEYWDLCKAKEIDKPDEWNEHSQKNAVYLYPLRSN